MLPGASPEVSDPGLGAFEARTGVNEYPQGSVSLGPGAGGHRLGPHGGLLRLRKVVFGSQFTFFGFHFGVFVAPSKIHIFHILGHFWRLPGVSPELLGCQIWRLF